MPQALCFATIVLLLIGSPSQAKEKATQPNGAQPVRLFNADFRLPPNSRWREERIMASPRLKLSVDLGAGKRVKGSMSILTRQLLDVDVLADSKLRLRFVQRERINDIDFGGNRNRQAISLALDGKTVIAQRSEDGRWSAKFDGKRRPTAKESFALNGLAYLWMEGVYPDREVSIGETWKVDAKNFKNLVDPSFRKPSGTFEFTLARIVEHEGHRCAKITGKGKMLSETKSLEGTPGAEGASLDVEMDFTTIEIYRALDFAMDINLTMKGTMEITNAKDEKALRYRAEGPVELTRTLKAR